MDGKNERSDRRVGTSFVPTRIGLIDRRHVRHKAIAVLSGTAATAALIISFAVIADIIEGGRGMLFGADHAFAITATSGWVLDNQSGVGQGIHMAFYPKEETWTDSSVIIYGRATPTSDVRDVKTHVKNTVRDFQKDGNPKYTSEKRPPLTLPNGRKAQLYFYSGDQWGNYEAAVYFRESDTINYLVFNSRTKKDFDKYLGDFLQIASSYHNLYKAAATVTAEIRDALKKESSTALEEPGGKEYQSKATQAIGQTIAIVLRDCTAYMRNDEIPTLSYFVRIDKDGGVVESNIYPSHEMSVCFSGLMSGIRYPAHTFNSFLLNIEVKITP
jgi:hypothetical protein